MSLDHKTLQNQLDEIKSLKPPAKRAAYSDRMAWLMASMSQLAYEPFEGSGQGMLNIASQLAQLNGDVGKIATRLLELNELIKNPANGSVEKLEATLNAGGFELITEFNKRSTDTQGFIATYKGEVDEQGFTVIVFRGTQELQDWKTNLDATTTNIERSSRVIGKLHAGFNAAYLSVDKEIKMALDSQNNGESILPKDRPIYITGHSLGGALATVATWYLSGHRLAACYTFGAPRVGNPELEQYYRTPVYRVVNAADPVPFVPPGGGCIELIKLAVRNIFPIIPILASLREPVIGFLVRRQGYRHYGDIRYLTDVPAGADGKYEGMLMLKSVGAFSRLARSAKAMLKGNATSAKRLIAYHDIGIYRDKLRAYALKRQTGN